MINLFQKPAIGLDIADYSIEVVELGTSGTLEKHGRIQLPAGIVVDGRIQNKKKLAAALKKVFIAAKITSGKVVFGLPENQVYIAVVNTQGDIQKSIPLPENEMVVVTKQRADKKYLVVACAKSVLAEWKLFFEELELDVVFDAEPLATIRSLFPILPKKPVCVVDMGSRATAVMIVGAQGLQHSFSIAGAGNAFTQEIATVAKVSQEKAEEMKKKFGLSNKNKQVFSVLTKLLLPIVAQVQETQKYFGVQEVVLIGGSSQIKGIVEYYTENLEIPVRLGVSALTDKLVYFSAIGLALREAGNHWEQDPVLVLEQEKPEKKKVQKVSAHTKQEINVSSVSNNDKLRTQKIILAVLVAVGIIFVVGAFWYRSNEKTQQAIERESQSAQYAQTQVLVLQVPVAVIESEYTPDRVRGRIVTNTIATSGSYTEALANSRRVVEKELAEQERLWPVPTSKEQSEFPMTFTWLMYVEQDVNDLLIQEVEKRNTENKEFALSNIEKTSIQETDNSDIYYITGNVTLSLNERIVAEQSVSVATQDTVVSTIIVLDTPTGFLNVRKGPGISFEAFAEIQPGENYILLAEQNGWYNIQIDKQTNGWIFSNYAKKQQ
jgi:type IV pilus assembly protein PilM